MLEKDPIILKKIKDISLKNDINISPIYFDLAREVEIKEAIRALIKKKVIIDILVNSAGVIHGALFQMTHVKKIKEIFEINFFGTLEVTQLICKIMVKNKRGSIINIASSAGIDLSEGNCAYGTSKAAIIAFTKTLSSEMSKYGIRVNAIAPSLTDTDMGNSMEATKERGLLESSKFPLKRMALPKEISNTVKFLASEESSFINGEIIRVDGGNRFN